jgi:hypothetical protein
VVTDPSAARKMAGFGSRRVWPIRSTPKQSLQAHLWFGSAPIGEFHNRHSASESLPSWSANYTH